MLLLYIHLPLSQHVRNRSGCINTPSRPPTDRTAPPKLGGLMPCGLRRVPAPANAPAHSCHTGGLASGFVLGHSRRESSTKRLGLFGSRGNFPPAVHQPLPMGPPPPPKKELKPSSCLFPPQCVHYVPRQRPAPCSTDWVGASTEAGVRAILPGQLEAERRESVRQPPQDDSTLPRAIPPSNSQKETASRTGKPSPLRAWRRGSSALATPRGKC